MTNKIKVLRQIKRIQLRYGIMLKSIMIICILNALISLMLLYLMV